MEKHFPELSGGEVVEERVDYRAEIEKGVGDGVQRDVAVEVGHSPAGFGNRGHHETTDLVGEPAHHQRANNQTQEYDGLLPGHLHFGTLMFRRHVAPVGFSSIRGHQGPSQNQDHGSTHERHADEHDHVD